MFTVSAPAHSLRARRSISRAVNVLCESCLQLFPAEILETVRLFVVINESCWTHDDQLTSDQLGETLPPVRALQ